MIWTKKDELFEIFTRKLQYLDPEAATSDNLIAETTEEYVERLLLRGHIPQQFFETIRTDILEEVTDMFRKKTYGFLDLKSYFASQKKKTKLKKSN